MKARVIKNAVRQHHRNEKKPLHDIAPEHYCDREERKVVFLGYHIIGYSLASSILMPLNFVVTASYLIRGCITRMYA